MENNDTKEQKNGQINYGFEAIDFRKDELTNNTENTLEQSDAAATSDTNENNVERPVWGNSIEFLMSCIATSVGLGNIWRFPFIAFENGGGAFLIPYLIVLFLVGKPMYYLEMIIGQFTSHSTIKVWNISPAFRGIGIAQIIGSICVISYYSSLIALTLYYFFASFAAELPWSRCLKSWGTDCVNSIPSDDDEINTDSNGTRVSSSELYFLKTVIKEKNSIDDGIGTPDFKLTLCLLLTWVIVFAIIIRSVRSSGKAAYFLALFPYVIMIVLLVRAVTLEGASDGILYFLEPQWDQLKEAKVWYAATTQLFFSLSVGMGTIIMFSSYNKFDHNIYRDALIVTTLDTFTSLMAGITIFGILGNLAHNLGTTDIRQVVKSGTALAFISYPDAISKFDVVPQIFSVLFFFMLFVLGIGSLVALQSLVTTVSFDQFKIKYWKVAVIGCILGFASGLIYVTPGGQWMLNIVDDYGGTKLIFIVAIFELVAISWVYGIQNLCWDLEFMCGRKIGIYWRLCWVLVTPVILIVIFIYSMVNYVTPTYSGWEYPTSAIIAGWTIFGVGCVILFSWIIGVLIKNQSIVNSFKPNSKWGPKKPETHKEWLEYKDMKLMEYRAESNNDSIFKKVSYILLGKYP